MYSNMTSNITIEYDPKMLTKIKEIIKTSINKIKSMQIKNSSNYDIYYEIDGKFDEIVKKIQDLKSFENELKYIILLKSEILHIIYKNCEDKQFGHYDFVLELFNFLIEIWDAKINLHNNHTETELKKYEELQISFKKRYHEYRRTFYCNIYEPSGNYTEKELYKIHESLRG